MQNTWRLISPFEAKIWSHTDNVVSSEEGKCTLTQKGSFNIKKGMEAVYPHQLSEGE